ncbi:hypothetical protein [Microbacterium sp. che218]|uniref:hypothetical protein n=1 Tax=Microbacterium sp. che218 TaxID=3140649 RepID=UPI003365C44F
MSTDPQRPLSAWRFDGTLRAYQADALDRVDVDAGEPLHLVAPPGAGKTLLGLLLAMRRGGRAVVFAPTTAIRAQWASAARGLAHDTAAVSDDPDSPAALTALTYQAISVVDSADPFAGLARRRWLDELEADARTPDEAERWLDALASSNPPAHRRGIRSRSRALRRSLARYDAEALMASLHPHARELIDRLVDAGVETVILDECHHLLDHWALVVAALLARLRAAGRAPLVIGLTATLPSPDDADEYDNYVSLLGDVDLEVPVPAVVREGDLAPYRDLVHVVAPTAEEQAFLGAHAEALQVALHTTFSVGEGRDFLVRALQPPEAPAGTLDPLEPPPAGTPARTATETPSDPFAPPPAAAPDDRDAEAAAIDRRLALAFAADFAGAEAAAAMLALTAPGHPVVARMPAVARRAPSTDETVRLIGRYALERVLPDPSREPDWQRLKRLLADFGYALTDRGVRRSRDAIDTVLSSSLAKDRGACDVLARERAELGTRLRALVVTDFVTHGNTHGGLLGSAGAVRTFSVVITDAATQGLRAVLVTSSTVRIAAVDADLLLPVLSAELGVEATTAPCDDDPAALEVRGIAGAGIVRVAARLLASGAVDVVVGTRGLFGEGWDCPAVNTLIDLTAVATASATQQLRGRTLRLDPAWPEKVAHNWTITAMLPPSSSLQAQPDAARLTPKHDRLWGLDVDRTAEVVRGIGAALGAERRRALDAVREKTAGASLAPLSGLEAVPPRAQTRADWRVGTPYVDREEAASVIERPRSAPTFSTSVVAARALGSSLGAAVALVVLGLGAAVLLPHPVGSPVAALVALCGAVAAVPFGRAWVRTRRQANDAPETLRRIAGVVWDALVAAGRVAPVPNRPIVETEPLEGGRVRARIRMPSAPVSAQRSFGAALEELTAPIRSPRFVLEIDRGAGSILVRAVLGRAGRDRPRTFVAVPAEIGRRRDDAVRFAALWRTQVGPAALREVSGVEHLALMSEARRSGGFSEAARSVMRWD